MEYCQQGRIFSTYIFIVSVFFTVPSADWSIRWEENHEVSGSNAAAKYLSDLFPFAKALVYKVNLAPMNYDGGILLVPVEQLRCVLSWLVHTRS